MKKRLTILALATLTAGAWGQGLVSFLNNPTTLISVFGQVIPSGHGGEYSFALLAAPSGTMDIRQFTFTGAYATNQNAAGRINGGAGVTVSNWAPGETKAFCVVGWSTIYDGSLFNPGWILGTVFPSGPFGISAIAPAGPAGGAIGPPPPLIFGGSFGIQRGFNLDVPEPETLALAGLGTLALAISNWRGRRPGRKPAQAREAKRRPGKAQNGR